MHKQLEFIEKFFESDDFIKLAHRVQRGDERAMELFSQLTISMDTAYYFLKKKDKDRTDYEILNMQAIIEQANGELLDPE